MYLKDLNPGDIFIFEYNYGYIILQLLGEWEFIAYDNSYERMECIDVDTNMSWVFDIRQTEMYDGKLLTPRKLDPQWMLLKQKT